jgi:hypothetical protein
MPVIVAENCPTSQPIVTQLSRWHPKRKRRREAWNNEIRLATKGKVRKQRYPNKNIKRRPKKKFPF